MIARNENPVISKYIYEYPENKVHEFGYVYNKYER